MTVDELAPLVYGLYALLGAIFLAVFGGGWWLRGKFADLDKRIGSLESSLRVIESSLRRALEELADILGTQIRVTGVLIRSLRRQNILQDDDLTEIEHLYMEGHITSLRYISREEGQTHNPLSQEELDKLDYLISKAEKGELFNTNEVKELNAIVDKLVKERGSLAPGMIALRGLSALLSGIYLDRQGRK